MFQHFYFFFLLGHLYIQIESDLDSLLALFSGPHPFMFLLPSQGPISIYPSNFWKLFCFAHISAYMWNIFLKNDRKEVMYKTETDLENKFLVTGGEGEGEG